MGNGEIKVELSETHPLHESFDFIAFARKHEASIINLRRDAEELHKDPNKEDIAILICSAILQDKTSISQEDLPLPVPFDSGDANAEVYEDRFVSFCNKMDKYLRCLLLEEIGYMRRVDNGFEPTDKGIQLVQKLKANKDGNQQAS